MVLCHVLDVMDGPLVENYGPGPRLHGALGSGSQKAFAFLELSGKSLLEVRKRGERSGGDLSRAMCLNYHWPIWGFVVSVRIMGLPRHAGVTAATVSKARICLPGGSCLLRSRFIGSQEYMLFRETLVLQV